MVSEAAKEARREYMRQYRKENRERVLAKQREHYRNNTEKYKEYQQRYWERKGIEAANA
jgi:hypothetical protein